MFGSYRRAFTGLNRLAQNVENKVVKPLDPYRQQARIAAKSDAKLHVSNNAIPKANETTSKRVNANSNENLHSNPEILSEKPRHDTPILGNKNHLLSSDVPEVYKMGYQLSKRKTIAQEINNTINGLSPKITGLILDSRNSPILSQIGNVHAKFAQAREISTAKDYRSPTTEANEKLWEEICREIACQEGKTYEQMCKEVDEHARYLFKDAEPWTRTQPKFLEKILETGVFKSLPELDDQASHKRRNSYLLSADTRIKMEQQVFGYPKNHPVGEHAFYGHPSDDNYGNIGKDLVDSFGNIAIRFKEIVLPATTLAADDTAKHSKGSIKPAPWNYLNRGIFPLMKYVGGQLVKKYQNPLEIKSMHDIHPYPEIQIHPSWLEEHRLTLEHVDLVVIRNPLYDRQLKDDQGNTKDKTLSLIAALEKRGIKYRIGQSDAHQRYLLANVEWLKKQVGSLKFLDRSYQ